MPVLEEPKVSVCIITYNHGYMLHECLQSVVEQVTNFPFEIIVGDDCSTDEASKKILQKFAATYPDLIVPIYREKNMGGHGTQNWLDVMRKARGKYIANIDGDDRMLPGKLMKQAAFLDLHSDCSMVAHNLRIFDGETGEIISNNFNNFNIPEKVDINFLLLNRCYFGHSSKMFRKSTMITQFSDHPIVDFYFHIEQASKGYIGYINELLGEYRKSLGVETNSSRSNHDLQINAYHNAFNRALELGVDRDIVKRGRLNFNYSIAIEYLLAGDEATFKDCIALDVRDWQYISWRHLFLFLLSCSPKTVLLYFRYRELLKLCIVRSFLKIRD